MQQYPVRASKNVEVLMWTHSILLYLKLETWGEGVTGSRAFREGDKGIRVREWWEGGRIEGGEGRLREGWRQGAVREEWHWRGMRRREDEDWGTSHHWYKQHKCREVIYHWQECSESSLTTPLPCMSARAIFFAPPTFKVDFWPNLADSALAPPILSGVQRFGAAKSVR